MKNRKPVFSLPVRIAIVSAIYLFISLCVAIAMAAAIAGVQVPKGDQNWFFPVVYSFSQSYELKHPFWSAIPSNPGNLLVWHGWLMPSLQGLLTFSDDYAQIHTSGLIFLIPVLIGYFLLYWTRFGYLKAAVTLPILLCLLIYQNGRPELVGSGILLLFLLGIHNQKLQCIFYAISVGLMAITSPAAGLLLASFVAIFVAIENVSLPRIMRKGLWHFCIVCTIVLISTSIALNMPVLNWLKGVLHNAEVTRNRTDTQGLLQYYVLSVNNPNVILYFGLLGTWAFDLIYRHRLGWYLAFLGFMLVLIFLLAVRVPATVYNFTFLIPLILFLSFDVQISTYFRTLRYLIVGMVAAGALAASLALAHQSVMSILAIREGRDAGSLREALQRLPADARVAFDSPSFALIAASALGEERVLMLNHGEVSQQADFRVQGQAYSGQITPRLQPGECIFYSTFHTRPPEILGIPIAHTYKDWAFALIAKCP